MNVLLSLVFRNLRKNIWSIILFWSLIVFFCSYSSCRKKTQKKYYIPEYEKKWFWIDTGSYFIYADSLKNTDSIYVQNVDYRFLKSLKEPYVEIYNCTLSNGFVVEMEAHIPYILLGTNKLSDYVSLILYDPHFSKSIYSTNGAFSVSYLDSIYPSYSLRANKFDTTVLWHVHNDYILQSDSSSYYFSKGIGFVRIIDHERLTHKYLVRYKVQPMLRKLE